jgi:hypothetical protein
MKRFAAARPMPVAPPVITAVFRFSLFMYWTVALIGPFGQQNEIILDRLVVICYTLVHGTPSKLRSNGNVGDDTIGLLG